MAPHEIMAGWLEQFEPASKAAGKQFDKDMEAASLAFALDAGGFAIVPKEPTPKMIDAACETEGCKVVNSGLVLAGAHGFVMPNSCVERAPLNQMWDAMITAA
jgi:hypothetical protein